MPFRDAGYSQADYVLNIQDVIYGVWRAKEEGLCGLKDFSLEESVTSLCLWTDLLIFSLGTRSSNESTWAISTG